MCVCVCYSAHVLRFFFTAQNDVFTAAEYRYWNTNNMWVSLSALQKAIKEDTLDLAFVVNVRVRIHFVVLCAHARCS